MNNLPEFKDIELSDKEWADPLLAVSDYRATEYCFTSLYIWARFFGTRIARWKDWLLVEGLAAHPLRRGGGLRQLHFSRRKRRHSRSSG